MFIAVVLLGPKYASDVWCWQGCVQERFRGKLFLEHLWTIASKVYLTTCSYNDLWKIRLVSITSSMLKLLSASFIKGIVARVNLVCYRTTLHSVYYVLRLSQMSVYSHKIYFLIHLKLISLSFPIKENYMWWACFRIVLFLFNFV